MYYEPLRPLRAPDGGAAYYHEKRRGSPIPGRAYLWVHARKGQAGAVAVLSWWSVLMGSAANCKYANLEVLILQKGERYYIDEYDGVERIVRESEMEVA